MKLNKKETIKRCVQAGLVLVCTLCILCAMYLASLLLIPREAVREHILESAYIMEEQGNRYELIPGAEWTTMDNYADAEWLNILYSLDPDRPWQTMLESPIYVDFDQELDLVHALKVRVEEEKMANTVYDRYWHGMVMVLRPLLLFMNMEEIHIFMMILGVLLFVVLALLLWKRGLFYVAVMMAIAAIPCGVIYVPFCAEYWAPFFFALFFMLYIAVRQPGCWEGAFLMLISGVCMAYFDFLTTEVIAFGFPYMLMVLLWKRNGLIQDKWKQFLILIRSGILWVFGYASTMLLKWAGSSCLLGENRFAFSMKKVEVWQSTKTATQIGFVDGLFRNFRMMWPFRIIVDDTNLVLVLLAMAAVIFVFVFLFYNSKTDGMSFVILFLSALPLVRYILLRYHMQYHAFFTYRSFYFMMVAAAVFVVEAVDWKLIKKRKK